MSETMDFKVAGILPVYSKSKSADPVGDDVNKIVAQFAQLLISQISNQDPDKPADNTQIISQYAQMLSTLGQVKANKVLDQSMQVQVSESTIGKTIAYTIGQQRNPATNKMEDVIHNGVVTAVDFTLDTPRVYVDGAASPVPIADIRGIAMDNQTESAYKGALVVGKTVDYAKSVPNPAYIDPVMTPTQQQFLNQSFTGIVTAVDFSSNGVPMMTISGETEQIPLTKMIKIQG